MSKSQWRGTKRASHSVHLTHYRGRFAPSPTGPLHFGSLVAAVSSYLDARSCGGEWLLRIEDLDPPREPPGAAAAIMYTLERFGFTWDGPILWQSEREQAYQAAAEKLAAEGYVYPCACSRRQVRQSSTLGLEGAIYPGTCRAGLAPGRRARALRLRVRDEPIAVTDALLGEIRQNLARDIGDFIIRRADELWTYQLAVAVDDAAQGVTHVVRGADLALSTPRQVYLQQLLELPRPQYLHLPVATDKRGRKLSKQTHAAPVDARHACSWLLQALCFLRQKPPVELADADLKTIWQWAINNWNVGRASPEQG